MVNRPETDGAVYVTGWTISGLAVLGAVVVVWVLGISGVNKKFHGRQQGLRENCGGHALGEYARMIAACKSERAVDSFKEEVRLYSFRTKAIELPQAGCGPTATRLHAVSRRVLRPALALRRTSTISQSFIAW